MFDTNPNQYKTINQQDISFFNQLLGEKSVSIDEDEKIKFSHDETEDFRFLPEIIVKPSTSEQISSILKYCNENKIPVTPRGAGTGLSGGALPVMRGIVLSMEKMNKILNIDERNLQVTVEAGVITEVLHNAVKAKGLFYPPDPSSKGSCFIGGNLAHAAGGPKAVKYGTTRDYVLSLDVVLANGDIIHTGANVLKNSTGYSLTHLMIGSEGTLGIITSATLKLMPLPNRDMLMLVPFYSAQEACQAVSDIFRAGIIPSGLEFMERDAIDWGLAHIHDINIKIEEDIQAHLLVEVDGNDEDLLMKECELIYKTLEKYKTGEILLAESQLQKDLIKKMRSGIGEAVKKNSVYRELDTVVPRAELPELLKGVKTIGNKYGMKSVCYGHAGDGNLHVNMIRSAVPADLWKEKIKMASEEIFKLCLSLGGTISGEHGIGYVQKEFLPLALGQKQIDLMQQIKRIFDPNNILNPGKIFIN